MFQVTGVFSKEYIPQGTRFGPLQGDIYTKDNVPNQANRKYFWRVRETHKRIRTDMLVQPSVTQRKITILDTLRRFDKPLGICFHLPLLFLKKKKKLGCSDTEVSSQ